MANRRYRARKSGKDIPLLIQRWSPYECMLLREAYLLNVGSREPWLKAFAKLVGRHPANVVRKAKLLGCETDRNRKLPAHLLVPRKPIRTPEEKRAAHSLRMKAQWKKFPHPRGMNGKTHTPEVRARISAAHLGKTRPPFTEEHRLNISRANVARLQGKPASFSRKLNRGIVGRRADLGGQYFRSRYEANYARFLNYTKQEWTYEKKTFWFLTIKRGVRSYTPDFYLPATDEYHEVKGWMDAKSQTKLKRMKKYYPSVKIVVVDGEWFKAANRQGMCRLIPGWECSHKGHGKGDW